MAYKSCKDTIDLETMGQEIMGPGTRTTKARYKRGIKNSTWAQGRHGQKRPEMALSLHPGLIPRLRHCKLRKVFLAQSQFENTGKDLFFQTPYFHQKITRHIKKQKHGLFKGRT